MLASHAQLKNSNVRMDDARMEAFRREMRTQDGDAL